MTASVKEIRGFNILPVQILPTAVAAKVNKDPVPHYIYFKKHAITSKDVEAQELANRSLFVVNLPIFTSLSVVKSFLGKIATGAVVESLRTNDDFENYADIDLAKLTSDFEDEQSQVQHSLPLGCSMVTFVDKQAAGLAFSALKKASNSSKKIEWEFEAGFGGVSYFDKLYGGDYLSAAALSQQVSHDMAVFAQREADNASELQNMREIVDEDGFTLVVGSHRKTKSGVLGKLKAQQNYEAERIKLKGKKKEKQDFYRFQIREKKKQEMNDLLNKFKEDQEKIKIMKEKKRFRPY